MGRTILLKMLLFFGIVFAFCTCGKRPVADLPTFHVDVKQRDSASCFFSGYSYVMLETNMECLLTDVDRIKVDSEKIAVLDRERILFYEHDTGRFIGKIDRLGKGHNEYLSIDDFIVRDSLVYVLSAMQYAILVYDVYGHPIKEIQLDAFYKHFDFWDEHRVFLSSDFGNDTYYNFVLFDLRTGTVLRRFDEFSQNESVFFNSFSPFSGRNNKDFYVIHPFDYTIYTLTDTVFFPYCRFDFNTEETFDMGKSFAELSDQTRNKSVVKYLGNLIESDSVMYLTFDLFDSHGIGTYLYKRCGQQSYLIRINEDFISDFPYLSSPKGIYRNTLISVLSAPTILDIEETYGLSFFSKKGLNKEDNHVIFFHKLE